MKDTEIQLNEKNITLRLIAFAAAFLVAVVAFTHGLTNLGSKGAGLQTVDALPDEETPLYAANVTLTYAFTGSASENREQMNLLKRAYSSILKRSYILLDAEQSYENYVNLATLNAASGQAVDVGEELFGILTDACVKTGEGRGYNMFAGALYAEWNSILILDEPEDFDPLNNAEERTRIARLAEMTNDLSHFRLEVVDASRHTVRLDVSGDYRALLNEYELDAPVVDLNLLHDAYELQLIADALAAQGYENGYLTSSSGLTLALPGYASGEYCLYGLDGEEITPAATAAVEAGSAFSQFRSFAHYAGEYSFYTVSDGGRSYFRHPYLPAFGDYPNVIASSCALSGKGNAVGACYANICLGGCRSAADAAEFVQSVTDIAIGYTLQDEQEKTVYANAEGIKQLTAADYGYRVAPAL